MQYKNILFTVEELVGVVRFNRPEALNALNSCLLMELTDVIEQTRDDESVRVLILTGSGAKAFVAGGDITEFPHMNPFQARLLSEKGQEILFMIERFPKPVIACVNGFALGGGCEIAMACDFIYCSDNARFGQPEINLGLIPGYGGTQRLSRLVGKARAKELCMMGEIIDACRAQELGLVAKVFPSDRLMEETLKAARMLAKKPQLALSAIKKVIDRGTDANLRSGCAMEAESFGLCFASLDAREGVAAFLEKRKPAFRGSLLS
ncbi:MAG: enoyl-CoA hydratase/isomerase family protein [Syntrophobacteraceae bacterium]